MLNVANFIPTTAFKTKDSMDMMAAEFPLVEDFKDLLITLVSKEIPGPKAELGEMLNSQDTENIIIVEDPMGLGEILSKDSLEKWGNVEDAHKSKKDEDSDTEPVIKSLEENTIYPHPMPFYTMTEARETTSWANVQNNEISGIGEKLDSIEVDIPQENIGETAKGNHKPLYEVAAETILEGIHSKIDSRPSDYQINHGDVKAVSSGTATIEDHIRVEVIDKAQVFSDSLEVYLEDDNLGKIIIKATLDQEGSKISIVCGDRKTMELMTLNAKEIGGIIEENLGSPTTIIVEGEKDYLNHGNEDNGRNNDRNHENPHQRKNQDEDSQDFLQQLRLGLLNTKVMEEEE